MTTEDLRGALGHALQAEGQWYAYVSELWPYQNKFVYSAEGGSFSRSFMVAEDGTVTLDGDATAVQSKVVWEPVTLATFSAGVDYVEWEGELFRAGSYPDKGVEAPPELLRQWITDWSPAKLKVEHIDTPLDKVFEGYGVIDPPEVRGDVLWGKVRVPTWYHEGFAKTDRKVSVRLKPDHSGIAEVSHVEHPRITTAQVFSADVAKAFLASSTAQFSGVDLAPIRRLAEFTVTDPVPPRREEPNPMNPIIAFLQGLTAEQKQAAGITDEQITAFSKEVPEQKPEFSDPAARARIELLERQIEAQNVAARGTAALNFYGDQLQARRVTPAQKDETVALFSAASEADAKGGAAFGTDGPVVKALKTFLAKQPALFHTAQVIPVETPTSPNDPHAMTPERARAALGLPEGN